MGWLQVRRQNGPNPPIESAGCRGTNLLLSSNRLPVITEGNCVRKSDPLSFIVDSLRDIKGDAIQNRFESRALVKALKGSMCTKQSVGVTYDFDHTAWQSTCLGG